MDQQNPYEAPQSLALAPTVVRPPVEFDRRALESLARGASFCHDALMTVISLIVGILVLLVIYTSSVEFVIRYIVPLTVAFAGLLHVAGLVKLRQVPAPLGTSWLFTVSLVMFSLSLLHSFGAYLIFVGQLPLNESTVWLLYNPAILRTVSFVMLLSGLFRVGRDAQVAPISRWSMATLGCLVFVVLLEAINYFPSSYFALAQYFDPETQPTIMIVGLIALLLTMISGLVFYTLTLKNVMRLDELLSPVQAELVTESELTSGSPQPMGESA